VDTGENKVGKAVVCESCVFSLWLAAVLMVAAPAGAQERDTTVAVTRNAVATWFPSGTLFPALAADMKEPRNYASFRRTQFVDQAPPTVRNDRTMTAALLSLGTEFGLWVRRNPAGGDVQVGIAAGVFTQFDVGVQSPTMINADYIIGPQLTYRRGDLGVRSRIIHQSSHLGDGLLRRANDMEVALDQRGPSMEWADALFFVDGRHVRVYGTGRYVFNSITRLAPWQAAGGAELRARRSRWGNVDAQPFVAVHVEALEARSWGTTRSAVAGISVNQPGAPRGLRLSAVYQNGFTPFGKFFTNVRVNSYGLQLEFIP
jgi:hypothetical protein